MDNATSAFEWARFLGAFHPVLVHLPVGFVVLLALLETLALHPRFKHLTAACRTILMLTLPAALVSAVSGWLLAQRGSYDAELLKWHRWTGVSLTAVLALLAALQRCRRPRIYRLGLGATLVLVTLVGHWGGSLTHGRDYLLRAAPNWLHRRTRLAPIPASGVDPLQQPVYVAAIQPIFAKYCVSCHGPEKAKAGLRLTSREELLKGGDNGPVLAPGAAEKSLLIQQLLTEPDEQNHMPPDGKPQPTQDDLALLQWWVDAGAPAQQTVRELNPPTDVVRILKARVKPSAETEKRGSVERGASERRSGLDAHCSLD